jgi:hypothetical protein
VSRDRPHRGLVVTGLFDRAHRAARRRLPRAAAAARGVVDTGRTLEAIHLALVDIDRALGAVARAIEEHGTAPIDISAMVMSIEHEDQLASAVGRALNRRRN